MSETKKDPGIRLFGRKIPVPECQIPANSGPTDACSSIKKAELEMPSECGENSEKQEKFCDSRDSKQEFQHKVKENEPIVNPKPVEDNTENGDSDQDKVLKKPDKILQCPRCNSLDTKFCYFNNYNVNQPRHFCKNCQRYWTAGGTMRNVPIGAGRRKNKHLASQYRHIMVSNGIPTSRLQTEDTSGFQHVTSLESSVPFRSSADNNSTVLKFGPDTPLCESMDSMLNLRDERRCVDASSINRVEYAGEPSLCGSSVTNNGTQGNELSEHKTSNWLQCYPVPPWVLPYPGWNNVNSMEVVHQSSAPMCSPYNTGPAAMQWCPTAMVAIPGMCPPSIPLQLVPPSCWSGTPLWNAGTGAVSIGSNACLSPSSSTSNSCCSGNGSPTLGKHARDTVFADEEKSEKCVLVPKTIRIDASKSPIRAALTIQHDQQKSLSNGDILKKIEPKEGKDRILGASQILEANPAAISRAHAFQESI
ncbi:hypothetical protein PHAVU_001G106400 [Phaseolus vulgaris]|uniref:Dof-type domain-containing protein n=1 Tax=Phaseolus vulgaris TaxID=3885 RepID=V7CUP4_PHAVU|nr:hypothetical protein PHAVU_001G106400g [Phaseolus vulgaris]ESW33887.1 hypothetical protein PHAVU_001G106400g [Phaseolus vulgaris]